MNNAIGSALHNCRELLFLLTLLVSKTSPVQLRAIILPVEEI